MTPEKRLDALAVQRAALQRGESVTFERVFKQFTCDEIKAENGERRQLRFTITTQSKDRMKDTIDAAGWRLENYRKNPVVLYGHDYRGLPVARSITEERVAAGISSVAEFATKEQYPFADTVYQLIQGKFLNATSVGFDPLKWVFNEETHGIDFKEQDLLEYSIVPVPANPECLIEAAAKGIDVEPMREWAEKILDGIHPEPGMWVPRRQMERLIAALPDHNKVISIPAPAKAFCSECKAELVDGACPPCTEKAAAAAAARTAAEREHDCPHDDCPHKPKVAPPAGRLGLEIVEEEFALVLVDEIVSEEAGVHVDAAMIKEAFRDVLAETVKAALNRARGRVD